MTSLFHKPQFAPCSEQQVLRAAMENITHPELPGPQQATPAVRMSAGYRSPSIKIRNVPEDANGDELALQEQYNYATHRMYNRIIHHRSRLPITYCTYQVPSALKGHGLSPTYEVNVTVALSHHRPDDDDDDDEIFEMDL